jgi:23S rRNA (uracil1939-C5)-methyltransferase
LQLEIEKLIYGGEGLARLPADERSSGKAVFVPFVLPGEIVEAVLREEKPGFARAGLEKIIAPSRQRIDPRCPYFERCGGCHYQHTDYDYQLEIKAAILKENLRRIARLELDSELQVHPSPPWNYRNRSRFKLQTAPEFALGYYKINSHELLPVEECPISSPLINHALAVVWEMGRTGKIPAGIQEIEFFTNGDDTEALAEVYCSPESSASSERFATDLKTIFANISSVAFFASRSAKAEGQGDPQRLNGDGASHLTYKTKGASYRVSASSFFQINRYLIDDLLNIVAGPRKAGATGTALDLYAGVGLFSSFLNREFERVIAVESSPTSHADLLYNSPANVKTVRATTEQYLENAAGKLRADLVVVDPPRAGLGERVIKALLELKAPRITYVSCDPATLARDLARLLQSGYRVEEAHLVDLFPQTYHLESVFHLAR